MIRPFATSEGRKRSGIMKRLIATCLVVVLFSASSAMVVVAAPITFIQTGTGSGMLNFAPFATSSFIITSQGDTDNRLSFDVGWSITHSSSSIVITGGLGTFDILTRTQTAVNNDIDSVVYGTAVSSRYLIDRALFLGPVDAAFSTWDTLWPIGPISGTGRLLQWNQSPVWPAINTTGGFLVFDDGYTNAVFTAIPEPATILLLSLGALLLRKHSR